MCNNVNKQFYGIFCCTRLISGDLIVVVVFHIVFFYDLLHLFVVLNGKGASNLVRWQVLCTSG